MRVDATGRRRQPGLERGVHTAHGFPVGFQGADVSEAQAGVALGVRQGCDQVKIMMSGGVASPYDPLDSLQFSLNKRFSRGQQFNVAYTFSKSLDVMSTDPGSTAGPRASGVRTAMVIALGILPGFFISARG